MRRIAKQATKAIKGSGGKNSTRYNLTLKPAFKVSEFRYVPALVEKQLPDIIKDFGERTANAVLTAIEKCRNSEDEFQKHIVGLQKYSKSYSKSFLASLENSGVLRTITLSEQISFDSSETLSVLLYRIWSMNLRWLNTDFRNLGVIYNGVLLTTHRETLHNLGIVKDSEVTVFDQGKFKVLVHHYDPNFPEMENKAVIQIDTCLNDVYHLKQKIYDKFGVPKSDQLITVKNEEFIGVISAKDDEKVALLKFGLLRKSSDSSLLKVFVAGAATWKDTDDKIVERDSNNEGGSANENVEGGGENDGAGGSRNENVEGGGENDGAGGSRNENVEGGGENDGAGKPDLNEGTKAAKLVSEQGEGSSQKSKAKADDSKAGKSKQEGDDDDDSDDSDEEASDEDESDSGDEDMIAAMGDSSDEDGEDDSSDEEDGATPKKEEAEATPKKAEISKKRGADSATKTPVPEKKAKLVSPFGSQKTGGGKKSVHTATPYPTKHAAKTPANTDKSKPKTCSKTFNRATTPYPTKHAAKTPANTDKSKPKTLKSCSKTFNSDSALQSHTKATTPYPTKHAAKTPANTDKSKPKTPKSCSKTFNSDSALQSHTKAKA